MKQVLISDEAFSYLCKAARQVKESTGEMPTFGDLIDEMVTALDVDWC